MRIEKKNKGTGFFGNSINAKDETKIPVIKSKESTIVDTIETGDRKNILEVHIENLESYTSTELEILFRYLDENYSQIKSTLFYEKNGFTHNNCILHIREKKQNEYMDSLTLSKQDQQIVMECLQSIKENVLLDKEEKADRIDKLIDDINSKKTIAEIQESYNPQFNSLKFLTIVLGTVGTSYLLFSEEDHLSPAMNFVMSMICSACSMKTAYNIASADLPKNEAAGGALAIAGLLGLGGLSLVHQVFLENDVPNNFSCG